MRHADGVNPQVRAKIADFTKLFWANRGNHNEMTAQKFLPGVHLRGTEDARPRAVLAAGGFQGAPYGVPPIRDQADLDRELTVLQPSLFDPAFRASDHRQKPAGQPDILEASANNFYFDVSMKDLKDFHDAHPLNSRLVKTDARQAGGRGLPRRNAGRQDAARLLCPVPEEGQRVPGESARAYAEPGQDAVLAALIRYYQTGDPADWIRFGIAWVQNNPPVDFANGFIEVYRDARAAKGTSQSFVTITDQKFNGLMTKIAANAQYFEDHAPWLPQYKKQGVKPPLAKAVETVIETGDFHVSTVGDNLPNENEIREKYGSKSFLFTGSSRTLREATGFGALEEFAASPEEVAICKKYGDEAIRPDDRAARGHRARIRQAQSQAAGRFGSLFEGILLHPRRSPRRPDGAVERRRSQAAASSGLVSSPDVGKAMYYAAVRVALTQLERIPKGDTIEEDHQRNRQLIVNYMMDKTGAIEKVERGGKTYLLLKDFDKMHQGVGMLLAELMRIKAEGDYAAIKALVDKYAVHFDPEAARPGGGALPQAERAHLLVRD